MDRLIMAYPQTDPGWWAAMGDAIKHAADTGNQVEAANIWVQYLVAGTILAENIMSKQLTLKTGGLIKSENYKAGQQGFCINADGSCNFSTIVIEGNALFKGDIESGPLILNSINPSTPGTVWKYSAGEYTDNLYYNLQSTPSGIYGANILIGAIGLSPAQPASYYSLLREYDDYIWKLMFKDKDLNTITYQYLFQGRVVEQDLTIKIYDGNYPAGSGSQYRPQFPCDLQIGFYNPTGKTFRLLNLPTNEPDVQGAIWVDSGKYLRIKQ